MAQPQRMNGFSVPGTVFSTLFPLLFVELSKQSPLLDPYLNIPQHVQKFKVL